MNLDMLQMRCRVFSILSCYSFELDRNYIFQDVVWWKMKYYRKYEHGKRKIKVLKLQTEIWPRRKKLLQVTTFCCCTIFHLLRDAVKSSGCFWADLLWVRWAAEQKETMKTSWSRRSAADEEEWWCRSWDRSEATDQTSAGHQQLDMEAEDSTLSWRTLRKRSEVSPLERKCWCGQFERCSRWRIQTSVRMELLSDWRLHSHLFPETVNTKPDTTAEK